MALNMVTGGRSAGPVPPRVINQTVRLRSHAGVAPLEREPMDRPPSKTGVHPPPLTLHPGQIDLLF